MTWKDFWKEALPPKVSLAIGMLMLLLGKTDKLTMLRNFDLSTHYESAPLKMWILFADQSLTLRSTL